MSRVRISRRGVVKCAAALKIPLSAGTVWGQLRDFRRFASQEFFHGEVKIEGGVARVGAALSMSHRFAIFSTLRRGRILWWREGVGFSFSDLSLAGSQRGFPHVFSYRIEPVTKDSCRLHVTVRGLWTAKIVPRFAAWIWLKWVMRQIVTRTENDLLVYRLWRSEKSKAKKNCLDPSETGS